MPADPITTSEAATLLDVSVWTVARWARHGKLPYLTRLSSGSYLFDRAAVEALADPKDAA